MPSEDDTRPFPIQADHASLDPYIKHPVSTIPWWLAEIAYEFYAERYGRQQSLERLAERGGFGREELVWMIRRFDPIAKARVPEETGG